MTNILTLCYVIVLFNTGHGVPSNHTAPSSDDSQGGAINLSGCPRLRSDCNFDCLAIGRDGCIVCTCAGSKSGLSGGATLTSSGAKTPGTSTANTNSSSSLVTGGSSPFSGGNVTGILTGSGVGAGASRNNNGCPAFPTNCDPSCAKLDGHGCPICSCAKDGGSTSHTGMATSGGRNVTSSHQGAMANNNGCPPFPTNCRPDCVALDTIGCPLCSCTAGSSSAVSSNSNNNNNNNNNHVHPGAASVNNGCPAFSGSCSAECTTTNDAGCPVCTCAVTSPNSGSTTSNTSSTSTSAATNCPTLVANCNSACLWLDRYGCVLCNGDCNEKYKSIAGSSSGKNVTSSTSGGSNTGSGTSSKTGSTTIAPPTVGSITCTSFDSAHCAPACLGLDNKGCLICRCGRGTERPSTVAPSNHVTLSPLLSATTFSPVMPGSGAGAISVNKTAGNGNGCPAFDSSCSQPCITIDAMGCLKCDCQGSQRNATTTPTGSGSQTGNGNGCPLFDINCPPGCASIDAKGCLSCTCAVTTVSPESTTVSRSGNANNCPPVDIFRCQPSCISLDSNGCILCQCKGITAPNGTATPNPRSSPRPVTSGSVVFTTVMPKTAPTIKSTTTTTTTTANKPATIIRATTVGPRPVVTVRCEIFDHSCPSSCTRLDFRGCLVCKCPKGVSSPAPPTTTLRQSAVSTTPRPAMCPPIRCVYPCDAGVTLGSDNCPICNCRETTANP